MPFMWVNSVFMSLMLMMMLVIMYSYVKSFLLYIMSNMNIQYYNIEW